MAKVNWLKVRTDYLAGETDCPKLAEKYGIARSTLYRRMESDKANGSEWKTVHTTVQQQVEQRISSQLGQEVDAAIQSASRVAVDNLQRHQEIETLQLDNAIATLKAVKKFKLTDKDGNVNTAAVNARKSAMDAAAKVIETSRLIHGVAAEMPSVRAGKEDAKPTDSGIEIRQRRLEPVKMTVGENGLKTG